MEEINKVALKQQDLGEKMEKILTNTKKDSATRKTESYISERLTKLERYWQEIQSNHDTITVLRVRVPTHNYFQTDYFQQLKTLYEEVKEHLQGTTTVQGQQVQEVLGNPEAAVRRKLQKRKEYEMKKLADLIQNADQALQQEVSKERCKRALNNIAEAWRSVENFSLQLSDIQENEDQEEDLKELWKEVDAMSLRLEEKLSEVENSQKRSQVPLQPVRLEVFDGNFEKWTTFYELFNQIVHKNKAYSCTEKLQYLKTHLRGEPSKLIQHLQISEENYGTAWEIITSRYNNKRLLVSKLVDKILDLPEITNESAEKIKQLHDVTSECLKAIDNLGISTATWGTIVARIISRKWDSETNKLYEQSLREPNEVQEFEEMMDFLRKRFQSLEAINDAKKKFNTEKASVSHSWTRWQPSQDHTNLCKCCRQPHQLIQCPKFRAMGPPARVQLVRDKRLCMICMKHDISKRCSSAHWCSICNKAHNTMLHIGQRPQPWTRRTTTTSHVATEAKNQEVSTSMDQLGKAGCDVILATALVKGKTSAGMYESLRVLVDPGSQASFITEEAAQLLRLPKQRITAEITGLGGADPKVAKSKIIVEIQPRFASKFVLKTELLVLTKLTKTLPRNTMEMVKLEEWRNHNLADPTYNRPGPIDIILGAEEYGKIVLQGLQKSSGLLAQNSEFGWLLSGNAKKIENNNIQIVSMITRAEEDSQLTKFWELEEVTHEKVVSEDDKKCEEIYEKTCSRNKNGSYTVKIPFKEDPTNIGESRNKAVARLLQLEKKFEKSKELEEQYKQFMWEYMTLGHMSKLPAHEEKGGAYYIPHHAVLKETSSTTKLRVVFDASCKTSLGKS